MLDWEKEMKNWSASSKETCLRNQKQVLLGWRQWTTVRSGLVWCETGSPAETITLLSLLSKLSFATVCARMCGSIFVPVVSLFSCLHLAGFVALARLPLTIHVWQLNQGKHHCCAAQLLQSVLGFVLQQTHKATRTPNTHTYARIHTHTMYGSRVCFVLQGEAFGGRVHTSTWVETESKVLLPCDCLWSHTLSEN